jgi:FecR protein
MRFPPTAHPRIRGPMRAASEPRPRLRAATGRLSATVHGGGGGVWVGAAGVLAALVLIATLGVATAQPAESIAIPLDEASSLDTSQPPLEGDWVVVAAAGEATWRPQGTGRWQPVAVGRVLPAPSEIETGPTGGVTLVLGGDRLVVASNSRLILMARGRGEDQRLRQERGRLRVDIEQRPGRAVEVRTPLLSLGIKGTSFEVAVDQWQSSVLVLEGQVTVSTANGAPVRLGPRQGLSQPADSNRPASPLELTDLAPVSRTGPVRWHLAAPDAPAPTSPADTGGADPSIPGASGSMVLRVPGSVVLGAPMAQARPPARSWLGAWLDDDRLLFTLVLVVGGGLVLLIVPGLVLGQNLRQHWLDRSTGKGKRRRSLIRGW